MLYFAYGSNMSSRRLKLRAPTAGFVAVATLHGHDLRFHKISRDGSGKCDAFRTGDDRHAVIGVIYEVAETEKPPLDRIEGIGYGYAEKTIELESRTGEMIRAFTYLATNIDNRLKPYHWYKHHVLTGAREYGLTETYLERIESIESISDPDMERHAREMAIYSDKKISVNSPAISIC